MKIVKKDNKIIAKNAILIESFLKQSQGLRFSNRKNLIFDFKKEKKEIIDMFFVFYPIDLVFLDKKKRVIELKENLKPFRFYKTKNKARYLLELNRGFIKNNKINIGDKIDF